MAGRLRPFSFGEFMKVQGEVVSFGLTRPELSRSGPLREFDGWRVMFRYRCVCGLIHDSQAFNVWPTGDHERDTVEHVCPTTDEHLEVELVRPN